jgi:hypothetical protein
MSRSGGHASGASPSSPDRPASSAAGPSGRPPWELTPREASAARRGRAAAQPGREGPGGGGDEAGPGGGGLNGAGLNGADPDGSDPDGPDGPDGRPGRHRGSRNPLATAALTCAILGAALITIPAALILAVLGLRRGRRTGRGGLRCWLAIGLSLAWAGAAAYLIPNLVRASDPGCVFYKNSALTTYNRVVGDVNSGSGQAVLSRDLSRAITQINQAARESRNPAAARSLHSLSSGLETVLHDVRHQIVVPQAVLFRLNRETGLADRACGTVRL